MVAEQGFEPRPRLQRLRSGFRSLGCPVQFGPSTRIYNACVESLSRLDGSETARVPQARQPARASASQLDVVIDDRVQPPIESNGMASWSNYGLRLAVAGDNPAIYDLR